MNCIHCDDGLDLVNGTEHEIAGNEKNRRVKNRRVPCTGFIVVNSWGTRLHPNEGFSYSEACEFRDQCDQEDDARVWHTLYRANH